MPEPVERIESFVNLSLVANFYKEAWDKLFKVETPERLFRPDGSLVELPNSDEGESPLVKFEEKVREEAKPLVGKLDRIWQRDRRFYPNRLFKNAFKTDKTLHAANIVCKLLHLEHVNR